MKTTRGHKQGRRTVVAQRRLTVDNGENFAGRSHRLLHAGPNISDAAERTSQIVLIQQECNEGSSGQAAVADEAAANVENRARDG